ncbi:hypothetical protein E5A73_09915 [Sphingomonas gei]|uniref:Uncharacterized protein n=1 Tax=Sphingomonas gei TaxID=1395960 RepID=A0A4S1XE35_9SPHN|nr:DUF5677 domain-containing protein [Sphingomonas gei]TGX53176.1 hypothetical protein E5A73_09915 [Sphingomonas gei]
MYTEDMISAQREWAEEGLMSARKLLPLMAPVATHPWQPGERQTIGFLLSATARASESALLLCAYGQLWDADILARSVLEGSLKFAYMLQSPTTFDDRHSEFAHDLFSVALMKDHRKCVELLDAVTDPDHPQWRPIRDRLLADDELAELSATYDRVHRRELENRWGFTGLVGELSRSGDPLFRNLGGMAQSYSMASHIHHMDMVGASIPLDRDRRSPERRETIHVAHEGRLISDILMFLYLRLGVGYRFVGVDAAPLAEARSTIRAINEKFHVAHATWMDVEYPSADVGE